MNKCEPVSHIKLLSADEEKGIGESDINQPTAVECEWQWNVMHDSE